MTEAETHYSVLAVSEVAPAGVIKAAHRALMKTMHPDMGTGDSTRAKRMNDALFVLSNSHRRQKYDAALAAQRNAKVPSGGGFDERAAESEVRDDEAWGEESEWKAAAGDTMPSPPTSTEAPESCGDFATEDPARLAGINVFDRECIDLDAMAWYGRAYPARTAKAWDAHPVLKKGPRFWARIFLGTLVILSILPLILIFAPALGGSFTLTDQLFNALLFLILLPGLAFIMGRARARARRGTARFIIYLLAASLTVYGVFRGADLFVTICVAWLAVYVVTVELFRMAACRTDYAAGRSALLSKADLARRVWGRAGGAIGNAFGTYSSRNLELDATGELMTAQLLDCLNKIPGVRILHDLIFPGSRNGGVDHAVLCGNRLALIDSKHWRSGDYYWLGDAFMYSLPNERPSIIETHFPAAVTAYAALFPKLQIASWTVLHSNDGGRVRTNNQNANGKPRLVTPVNLLDEVGTWLSAGQPTTVDRKSLSRLVMSYGKPL